MELMIKMKGKWLRFNIKICDKINHKWNYHFSENRTHFFRVCSRCKTLQEWRDFIPAYGNGWVSLVGWTKKGAKEFLAKHPEMNK